MNGATEDKLWRDAYMIAWIGACNQRAVQRTLDEWRPLCGGGHPGVRAIAGHLAFLNHESLGPEPEDLETVKRHAERLGLVR